MTPLLMQTFRSALYYLYTPHSLSIEYTFSKLDLVVVYDFAVGAMENWGVITGGLSD